MFGCCATPQRARSRAARSAQLARTTRSPSSSMGSPLRRTRPVPTSTRPPFSFRRMDTPAAEVDIDADLVRELLRQQHPDLAELPLELVANGWDNAILRLGERLAVRLPRREVAAV